MEKDDIIRDLEKQLADKEECLTDQKIETLRTEMQGMEKRLTERTDTLEKNIKDSIKDGFNQVDEKILEINLQYLNLDRRTDNHEHRLKSMEGLSDDVVKIKRVTNVVVWLVDHPKWFFGIIVALAAIIESDKLIELIKLLYGIFK